MATRDTAFGLMADRASLRDGNANGWTIDGYDDLLLLYGFEGPSETDEEEAVGIKLLEQEERELDETTWSDFD